MPLSRARDYLSIGEVLDAVRADFPDVSISKIRFLESEGLLQPERTPSGYRKFYDSDVERLRHILSLQRDQFLPLKVIKERLATGSNGGAAAPPSSAALPDPPGAAARAEAASPGVRGGAATDISLSRAELCHAAGLSDSDLSGLVEFGLIDGSKDSFDGDDLVAAKSASGLFRYGVEARHLKMYRLFAERESAFFEQIVSPVTRRRDPDAQNEAARAMHEIMTLARQFRDAMLRSSMRDLL